MARYGLLRGLGRAAEKIGDDIGERLKQERLQQYQNKVRGQEQAFTANQNQQTRDAQSNENQLNREHQQGQFDATLQTNQDQFNAGLTVDKAKLDLLVKQTNQALEQGDMGLEQARRVETLRETLVNPGATPEQRTQAAESLMQLMGESQDSFSAITTYGEPDPLNFNSQTRASGILNRRTGEVTAATLDPSAQGNDPLGLFTK